MIAWILFILALLNGGWMIFDGVHVLRHGKYFGPDVPGPWRHGVEALGLDPLQLGPVFVALGLGWIVAAFLAKTGATDVALIAAAVLSLWYLPLGTVISIVVLALLLAPRMLST